jgi:hypothetical protein
MFFSSETKFVVIQYARNKRSYVPYLGILKCPEIVIHYEFVGITEVKHSV